MSIVNSSVVRTKNRQIAIIGAFSALIILMGIPGLHLGYIQINPTTSLTIMHIPVALAAILAGLPGGLICGAVFGITSLVNAAANPSGILDPLFVNPLISVLPRMLFGAICWIFFKLLDFIPHFPKTVNAAVTAFIGSVCHTLMVIGSLFVFAASKTAEAMSGAGYLAVIAMLLPNSLMEALAATIVCAAVTAAIFISEKAKPKLFKETENEPDEKQDEEKTDTPEEN